jgi:hypothetical protein
MLVTWVDILFVTLGGIITILMLRRRWRVPSPEASPHRATLLELILTALALLVAAIGPNILVVALTPGMPEMPLLTKWALIPSLVLLVLVWVTAKSLGMTRLTNRIWTGVWVGGATTAALDVIRLTGFQMGFMPGNMPRMFGVLILDQMALGPSTLSDLVGYLYHYWVGACFGLTYALLVGRSRWWGGLIWGLIIELGMMTTPPMVVAMDTGYFGLKQGYGILTVSLTAHIVYGIALGLLLERYVRHAGSIVKLLVEALRTERPRFISITGEKVS